MNSQYSEIRNKIQKWFENYCLKNKFEVKKRIDNAEKYYIVVESLKGSGELIIAKGEYAPYRYISFDYALFEELKKFEYDAINYFYDKEGDSADYIIGEIKKGLDLLK